MKKQRLPNADDVTFYKNRPVFLSEERYVLGNMLRGWIKGNFNSPKIAWESLTKQFNEMYPSESGREVYMFKEVPIKTGSTNDRFYNKEEE